jgi:hypothetical protein
MEFPCPAKDGFYKFNHTSLVRLINQQKLLGFLNN